MRYIGITKYIAIFVFGYYVCYLTQDVKAKSIIINKQNLDLKHNQDIINGMIEQQNKKDLFTKQLNDQLNTMEIKYAKSQKKITEYQNRLNASVRVNVAFVRATMGESIVHSNSESASGFNGQEAFTQYYGGARAARIYREFINACYVQQTKYFQLIDYWNFITGQ